MRPFSSITYMHSFIGSHIFSQGWSAWNNLDNYNLSRYAEFENYGLGAMSNMRIGWSRQLTFNEARKITLKNVFGNWNPDKK